MRCDAREYGRARRSGRATSVRVAPTGTAVEQYQVPLGNRYSLREAGVIGLPSWSEKATQTETWVKVPRLSTTCPRRVVAFDGGRGDINRCMVLGDEFNSTSLNTTKWTTTTRNGNVTITNRQLDLSTSTTAHGGAGIVSVRSLQKTGYSVELKIYRTSAYAGGEPGSMFGLTSKEGGVSTYYGNYVEFVYANLYRYGSYNLSVNYVRGSSASIPTPIGKWIRAAVAFSALTSTISGKFTYLDTGITYGLSANAAWSLAEWYPHIHYADYGLLGRHTYVDYMFVRNYTPNEPIAGTAAPTATNRALCRPMSHADLMRAVCA